MATKTEVIAWMQLWKHQDDTHKQELTQVESDAYERGYLAALEDVKGMRMRDRVRKSRIGKQVSL